VWIAWRFSTRWLAAFTIDDMRPHGIALLCVVAWCVHAPLIAQPISDAREVRVAARVADLYPQLEPIYKDFHAHPELSLREEKTSARVADELEKTGFAVTRRVGGFGVVGVLTNGNGPTILVRTDLDALPVTEQTGAPYASSVTTLDEKTNTVGVMHACGHDMHMTVFLGTARVLSDLKSQWRGTLVMIGQPAEEKVEGARAMLKDGLFTRFPRPDYCVALHCASDLPAGSVGITEGYALANVDSVDITIRGVSGHGAWPHRTKDPVVLAAQTVLALQTIVSRETEPTQPAVVTVGSIHGGTKHNIIPDEVRLQLTLRSYSDEVRQHTVDAIKRMTRGLAAAAGIPEDRYPTITIGESVPATYNHPDLSRRLLGVFKKWFGDAQTVSTKPIMGAEDFGLFSRTEHKIPGCIYWIGTVDPKEFKAAQAAGQPLPPLHSSKFLPALEPTLKTGVTAMTAAVLDLMGKP
jgi:amidohydrolase